MKFTFVCILLVSTLLYGKPRFGLDTISLYLNHLKIGYWHNSTPEKINLKFQNLNDTLLFACWSDCGALDGTVINIKDQDSIVLQLTRISKSGILNHTTVMINPKEDRKQIFYMDRTVNFYATGSDFKNLDRNKVYHVFIQSLINKGSRELPVFDLELK